MTDDEITELAKDIKENGLRESIWLYEGKILDGRNRYRACEAVSAEPSFREYQGGGPLAFVVSLNLIRRHLNESQRSRVADRVANLEDGQRSDYLGGSIDPPVTQKQAAAMFNVSVPSIKRARRVRKEGTPELGALVDEGKLAVSQAAALTKASPEFQQAVVKQIREDDVRPQEAIRRVKAETIEKQEAVMPSGRYRVIYADPPWSYGNTQPDYHTEQRDHYPVMTLQDICELPVPEIAADDAVLFLWVTSPILEEAFSVISAWGFKYKASFVWDKVKHNMGHYNSVRHEFLLIGVRGSCQPDKRKLHDSVISEPRTTHSQKPELFYDIIEGLYTRGKRIELFARGSRKQWEAYGHETNND